MEKPQNHGCTIYNSLKYGIRQRVSLRSFGKFLIRLNRVVVPFYPGALHANFDLEFDKQLFPEPSDFNSWSCFQKKMAVVPTFLSYKMAN